MKLDEYQISYLTARIGKSESEARSLLDAFKETKMGKKIDWTRDHTDMENDLHGIISMAILKQGPYAKSSDSPPSTSNLGAERVPASQDNASCGAPDYLGLVLALQGFRIRSYPNIVNNEVKFCERLSIFCGDAELSAIGEDWVGAKLKDLTFSSPPHDPRELGVAFAKLANDGWPESAIFAVKGVFAFGPCNFSYAEQCALYSLHLMPSCLLAKQLLLMLLAQKDYQKNAPQSSPSDLYNLFQRSASVSTQSAKPQRHKPWWKFW